MHVLIRDDLIDRDYVSAIRWASMALRARERLRSGAVAAICGISGRRSSRWRDFTLPPGLR